MNRINKQGFTLVEILVVFGVIAVFLGTAISVFTNFRQGYSRSESGAILLQDAAMFLAQLRNDLNNAVIDSGAPAQRVDQQFLVEPGQLRFKVYDNREGKVVPAVYRIVSGKNGGEMLRKLGISTEKGLIKNSVASISWYPEVEHFSGKASGTMRLSLVVKLSLKTPGGKEKPFELNTRIFPARLNRQLNSR